MQAVLLQFTCTQYKQMLYLEFVLPYSKQHLDHVLYTWRYLSRVQHSSERLKHGVGTSRTYVCEFQTTLLYTHTDREVTGVYCDWYTVQHMKLTVLASQYTCMYIVNRLSTKQPLNNGQNLIPTKGVRQTFINLLHCTIPHTYLDEPDGDLYTVVSGLLHE